MDVIHIVIHISTELSTIFCEYGGKVCGFVGKITVDHKI
jgi:hypothetical protein